MQGKNTDHYASGSMIFPLASLPAPKTSDILKIHRGKVR